MKDLGKIMLDDGTELKFKRRIANERDDSYIEVSELVDGTFVLARADNEHEELIHLVKDDFIRLFTMMSFIAEESGIDNKEIMKSLEENVERTKYSTL